jgi:Domain of unknown function (DUF4129)
LTRRVAIAALVVPALVLVAIAARSYQPLGGEPGGERAASTTFLDSLFTIVVVLAVLLALILIYVRVRLVPQLGRRDSSVYSSLLVFLLFMGLVVFVGYRGLLKLDRPRPNTPAGDVPFAGSQPVQPGQPVSEEELARPHVVWPLAVGIGGIIAAAIVIAVLAERRRNRRDAMTPEQLKELRDALDEAIEDLRRDPDPRRAVVAAYARMEQALTVYGLPRRPAEAPYEYLLRIGRELEAEEPVAALTELFEVAKFSEHSVDETMRGRAIDALTDVRREVRTAT